MTSTETKKLVAVLIAAFPSSKPTLDTVTVYERMLADLDYAAANAAVERLLATARWMPTVAEIREAAHALIAGEIRPGADAWGSVLKAMGRWGVHRTPGVDFQFADPVVAECVAALNWRELCSSENAAADRARFIELYDKLAAVQRKRELSDGLPAMRRFREIQESQKQRALPEAPPRSIGDVVRLVLDKAGES